MTLHQHLPSNPRSIKTRFAIRFLQTLKRLNKNRPISSSLREIHGRYRIVKLAADASMASVVGSRRVWSRALLWKIRNRALRCNSMKRKRIHALRVRRRGGGGHPTRESGFGQANDLRKLVPGGEVMDICSLLDETADYIKCLTTQVQVMRNIADLYTS
ncbi:unnamed protein product [Ilex paraguariensis]|uniref:IBH1-like N-terminal domain-containing protein n=1 Tax=Ilex paraguariensis TaxID=185542 RepID=A0ABC8TP54_9AQUA